jgi:hypothetical protein
MLACQLDKIKTVGFDGVSSLCFNNFDKNNADRCCFQVYKCKSLGMFKTKNINH